MKKLAKVLFGILLIAPLVFGAMFLSPNLTHNATQTAQNGGGGANLLDSPKIGNNSDFEDPTTDDNLPKQDDKTISTWVNPIYKTYEDYYIDFFNLPSDAYTIEESVVTINYSGITRTTANGETSLKYNGVVFDTITQNDYVGKGTMSDPYIARSTKGFLFLTNYSLSKIPLSSKHIEIGKDIVLNDEVFDKDGNPSGGDGVVYEWKAISVQDTYWNGNGHSIVNCYLNQPTKNYQSFFGSYKINEIKNLTMDGFYISGKSYTAGFGHNVYYVNNCVSKNGYMRANGSYASIFVWYTKEIKNCENYSTLNSSSWVCGAFVANWENHLITIENCVNYGEINCLRYAGGITGSPAGRYTIKHCKNFGNVTANKINAGGIAAAVYDGYKEILYCENYGNIYSFEGHMGGITGFVSTKATISYCKNFGTLLGNGNNGGGIAGYVFKYQETIVTISNCEVSIDYSKSVGYMIVGGFPRHQIKVEISNIKAKGYNASRNVYIFGYLEGGDIKFSNIEVELDATKNTYKAYFISTCKRSATIENVLVKSNCINQLYHNINYQYEVVVWDINSFAAYSSTQEDWFIGDDFSGFYTDWKSGKIGLKAFSGKGFYQGGVSESSLLSKGYVKKRV